MAHGPLRACGPCPCPKPSLRRLAVSAQTGSSRGACDWIIPWWLRLDHPVVPATGSSRCACDWIIPWCPVTRPNGMIGLDGRCRAIMHTGWCDFNREHLPILHSSQMKQFSRIRSPPESRRVLCETDWKAVHVERPDCMVFLSPFAVGPVALLAVKKRASPSPEPAARPEVEARRWARNLYPAPFLNFGALGRRPFIAAATTAESNAADGNASAPRAAGQAPSR